MPRVEERWTRLTPAQIRRRRRFTQQLLWVCAFALVPWTIYLALSLPADYNTRHWAVAWTGFDVLELIALAATAYFSWRRRQALIGTSVVAATLLVCDAWFDVSLDLGTSGIWLSAASAVFVELPLAFFLMHRAMMLMRLAVIHFVPELWQDGKPVRLTKMPLLLAVAREEQWAALEQEERELEHELEHELRAERVAQESDTPGDPAGNQEPPDTR
jgi:hypothetical protein